ncbi:TPA: glucose-1-phosphate adenylyltransferase subunit GlgD [Streptococcus pneumoniae]
MKIDKYSAILGNTVGFHNMSTLTDHRPVASLPFGGKYRLIDFPLSSLANAGVRSVFGIFQQDNISSVFDHIRSGREWGLSTLLSHYYLGIYNTRVESSTVGKEYYQQLLTYLKRSGSNQTVALNCDVLINIDLNQVFHLHSTTKEPITVVYKKLAKKDISEVNAILDVDETDHVLSHKLFDSKSTAETFNMSTDIFVVDTPWLIEHLEEEAKKEHPKKLRYVLRDLAVKEGAFAYEYTGYLANIHSVKSYYQANIDMLESQKFYSLFSPNQKIYTKVKNEEPTYYANTSKVSTSQFASGSIITCGIGELILHLISKGIKDIYIGVGGTASNDGGLGIAAGLGYQFYDRDGNVLPASDQSLLNLASVSTENCYKIPEGVQIHILADVVSPLCGHQGATYTFGNQKGLHPTMFAVVDQAIQDFYEKFSPATLEIKGAGAGGGLAGGLCAFAQASIVSGIDTCLDLINFNKKVSDADLVVVGEGRLDSQSFAGKAPIGVAKRTPVGVPVIAICGSLAEDLPPLPFENIQAVFSILEKSEPLEDSLKNASLYLERTAANIGHLLNMCKI